MDSRRDEMVEAVRATDFLLGRDEWGAELDPPLPARSRPPPTHERGRRTCPEQPHPDRVRLRFLESARTAPSRRRASPPGRRSSTPRAGTASRSTRPAAATARARSARCGSSPATPPISPVDPRAFTIEELKSGWRLACRAARAGGPDDRGAAAADAAEGRARRRRPARDPAARRAEALRRARASRRSRTSARISSACSTRWTTSSCACRSRSCARSAARCATSDWKVTARPRRRPPDRRRARRHLRAAATRSPSTSARRPSSRRCSTSRPGSRARCARSSTRSSRSART